MTTKPKGTERGSTTLLMVIVFVGLLMVVGLVVDGGQKLAADRDSRNIAEAAARAGANAVDGTAIYGGTPTISLQAGASRARQYLAAAGVDGTVTATGDKITVTASSSRPTIFLGAIGFNRFTSSSTSTAQILKR